MGRRSNARPAPFPEGDIATSTGTVRLTVDHDGDGVLLELDGVPSSHVCLSDPTRLDFEYLQQMATAIDWWFGPRRPLRAVHLGGAGCALPRALDAQRPGSRQLVAEVDAKLAELVRIWFALPRSPRLRIRAADGRDLLDSARPASADVIVRDAFAPATVPRHMTSVEFFATARRVLHDDGLFLANHAGTVRDPAAARELRAEIAALREVFDAVAIIVEPAFRRGRRHANVVSLAASDPDRLADGAPLERRLRSLPVPVGLVQGGELARFVGNETARHDIMPWRAVDVGT